MKELFYTDDFFAIYEKLDKDNVRCVALMDNSAAPDLAITETERYAKLFVAAPEMRDLLGQVVRTLDGDMTGEDAYELRQRIQKMLDRRGL